MGQEEAFIECRSFRRIVLVLVLSAQRSAAGVGVKTQRRSESSCERRMRLGRHSPARILQAPLPSVLNYVTVTRPAKATENGRSTGVVFAIISMFRTPQPMVTVQGMSSGQVASLWHLLHCVLHRCIPYLQSYFCAIPTARPFVLGLLSWLDLLFSNLDIGASDSFYPKLEESHNLLT